jgi:hypothetical protein
MLSTALIVHLLVSIAGSSRRLGRKSRNHLPHSLRMLPEGSLKLLENFV